MKRHLSYLQQSHRCHLPRLVGQPLRSHIGNLVLSPLHINRLCETIPLHTLLLTEIRIKGRPQDDDTYLPLVQEGNHRQNALKNIGE